MRGCAAELCVNWTGHGCVCEVFGIDKAETTVDDAPEHEELTCDRCDESARVVVQPEDVDALPACVRHLADVALAAIEAWGEHGVICIYSALEDEE